MEEADKGRLMTTIGESVNVSSDTSSPGLSRTKSCMEYEVTGTGIPLCPYLNDHTLRYKLVDLQFRSATRVVPDKIHRAVKRLCVCDII